MRRKAIEENPLDRALPTSGNSGEPESSPGPEREPVTFKLSVALVDKIRNIVYWTPGLTMTELAEEALQDAVDRLEKKRGSPFPPRQRELRGGRRIRS